MVEESDPVQEMVTGSDEHPVEPGDWTGADTNRKSKRLVSPAASATAAESAESKGCAPSSSFRVLRSNPPFFHQMRLGGIRV